MDYRIIAIAALMVVGIASGCIDSSPEGDTIEDIEDQPAEDDPIEGEPGEIDDLDNGGEDSDFADDPDEEG